MQCSVLIPTYARAEKLRICLDHLAHQIDPPEFEILIGVDAGQTTPLSIDIPDPLRDRTHIHPFPKLGLIAVRHHLLKLAAGRFFLSLNDDAYPHPDCLHTHSALHDAAQPRVVTGPAPFKPIDNPNLFDRIVHNTPLVFFPPTNPGATTPYATDYRNVFGLNFSAPIDLARELGGFPYLPNAYGYDETELVHRLITKGGAEALHAPNAIVTHDHRFTPQDVHRREYLLGRSAWTYAKLNPEFAQDLFGRDIRAESELEHSHAILRNQRADAQRAEHHFLNLANRPPTATTDALLPTLANQWTPLKRYLWRWGLLDAAANTDPRWALLLEAPPLP